MIKKINAICFIIILLISIFFAVFENISYKPQKPSYLTESLLKVNLIKRCEISPQELVQYMHDNPFSVESIKKLNSAVFVEPNLIRITTRARLPGVEDAFISDLISTYPQSQNLPCYSIKKLYEKSTLETHASKHNLKITLTIFSLIYLAGVLAYVFTTKDLLSDNV